MYLSKLMLLPNSKWSVQSIWTSSSSMWAKNRHVEENWTFEISDFGEYLRTVRSVYSSTFQTINKNVNIQHSVKEKHEFSNCHIYNFHVSEVPILAETQMRGKNRQKNFLGDIKHRSEQQAIQPYMQGQRLHMAATTFLATAQSLHKRCQSEVFARGTCQEAQHR